MNDLPIVGRHAHGFTAPLALIGLGFLIGAAARAALWPYETDDTALYLIPWYEFARDMGVDGLSVAFTNYAPFYSYLLLLAAACDGLLPPLALIKSISFVFELGSAAIAFRLAQRATGDRACAAAAFVLAWIAPSVLYNGAAWGQADSIWTFFVLLSVMFAGERRPRAAVIAFGLGFAVKAQAVFLGPFILLLILRRQLPWLWLAAVPVVYLLLAVPVLLKGREFGDVLGVYLGQAGTFRSLSMNAANLWIFVPNRHYEVGVPIGLALAGLGGLAWAVAAARRKNGPLPLVETLRLAAVPLILMPFLLPKMHERYFYAFELLAIIIATIDRRYVAIAVVAQVNMVFAYMPFSGLGSHALPAAALSNALILVRLTVLEHIARPRNDGLYWGALLAGAGLLLSGPFVPAARIPLFTVGTALLLWGQYALLIGTGLPGAGRDRGKPPPAASTAGSGDPGC